MTKHEDRQRKKNEALNKIRRVFHDKNYLPFGNIDGTAAEQREFATRMIIEELERDLLAD